MSKEIEDIEKKVRLTSAISSHVEQIINATSMSSIAKLQEKIDRKGEGAGK